MRVNRKGMGHHHYILILIMVAIILLIVAHFMGWINLSFLPFLN